MMEPCTGALAEHGLEGRTILVTRPEQQARALSDLIRDAGGIPVVFPALAILDVPDQGPLRSLVRRLADFDLAIFISPNAVMKAMSLIAGQGGLPPALRVATIGAGSARELERYGAKHVLVPSESFDSEALLDLQEMQDVAGKRVVIFRGEGGREVLHDALVARGAIVEYAQCYRRSKPGGDTAALAAMWARNELSGVVVTSSEGLRNLYDMIGDSARLHLVSTPLFVPHPRIAETGRDLGIARIVVTDPGDAGVVRSMIDWWRTRHFPNADG